MDATPTPPQECFYCFETLSSNEIVKTNCESKHGICRDCIRAQHKYWIDNSTFGYLRCCNEKVLIPEPELRNILGRDLARDWYEHFLATETPNQVYCSNSECLWPLHPYAQADSTATCRKCAYTTCTLCRSTSHSGRACGIDDDEERLTIKIANERGWKRCFRCRSLCERKNGCNIILCRCGALFHYLCGESVRLCRCRSRTGAQPSDNPVHEGDEGPADGQTRNNATHERSGRSGDGPTEDNTAHVRSERPGHDLAEDNVHPDRNARQGLILAENPDRRHRPQELLDFGRQLVVRRTQDHRLQQEGVYRRHMMTQRMHQLRPQEAEIHRRQMLILRRQRQRQREAAETHRRRLIHQMELEFTHLHDDETLEYWSVEPRR